MIGKLFPRLLNKSADRSAIKPNEFTEALNILVTSDDGGDGNIIKKANGTIASVIADPENFPFPGVSENIVGHLVDQDKSRVFYFAHGTDGSTNYSSIYLIKETAKDTISLMCLLRDDDLNFSSEDFVSANIIRVPVRTIDTGTDATISGSTGDDTSPFEDTGLDESDGTTSAFTVVQQPEFPTPFQISADDFFNAGFQYQGGNLAVANFGIADAVADITIEILANGSGVTVTPIFTNQGGSTATLNVAGNTTSLVIPFSFTVSQGLPEARRAKTLDEDFSIPFKITVAEQNTGNLTGTPFYEEYVNTVDFLAPDKLNPEFINASYQGNQFLDLGPNQFSATFGSVFSGEIPETEPISIIGPFKVDLIGQEPDENQYRPDMRVQIGVPAGTTQSPQPFMFEIAGVGDSINDLDLPNSTSFGGAVTSVTVPFYGDTPLPEQGFNFWLKKTAATVEFESSTGQTLGVEWIDTYGPEYPMPVTISAYQGTDLNFSTFVQLESGQTSGHSGVIVATIADVPTPADIVVNSPFGAFTTNTSPVLPNVDDNTGVYVGGEETFGFNVENLGETGGYFQVDTNWARFAYQNLSSNYTGQQDLSEYISDDLEATNGRWRGMWEAMSFEIVDPSSGQLISGPHKLRSNGYLNSPFAVGFDPLGDSMDQEPALQGWFNTQPDNIFYVDQESSVTVRFKIDNSGANFATAGYSGGQAEIGGDSTISDEYFGTEGIFSFWGQPNSEDDANPNFDLADFNIKVSSNNSDDLSTFTTVVYSSSIKFELDPNYIGPLKIWAPKTPLANGHPLIFDEIFAEQGAGLEILASAGLDETALVGEYGSTDGEKFFLAGQFSDDVYSSPLRSTIGTGDPTQWLNRLDFWKNRVMALAQGNVDIAFYNSSVGGSPCSVKVVADSNIGWFNASSAIEYNSNPSVTTYDVPSVLDLLQSFGETSPGAETHFPVNTGGAGAGTYNASRTGSLGPAWLLTDAFYISPNDPGGSLGYENLFNECSQWKPDPSEGAYDFDGQGSSALLAPKDHWHGGWRTIEFDVPPKHCRVIRLSIAYQQHGIVSSGKGFEDMMLNTQFPNDSGNLPDYTDYRNTWGLPIKLKAEWQNGVTNPEPNQLNLGLAMLVQGQTQYNNLV